MFSEHETAPLLGPRKSYDRPTAIRNFRVVNVLAIVALLATIGDFLFSTNYFMWDGVYALFCLRPLSFPLLFPVPPSPNHTPARTLSNQPSPCSSPRA